MSAFRLPARNHPKAEVTCPPLRWRAVSRRVARAGALAVASGGGLVALAFHGGHVPTPLAAGASVVLVGGVVGSLLGLAHAANAARQPVRFKVARGELTVTWPFLLTRRTRTLRTSDVTGITVSESSAGNGARPPTGRLVIRRRHRRALRVPGARPVQDLNHAAEALRAAVNV
jgi:hypothetical protein